MNSLYTFRNEATQRSILALLEVSLALRDRADYSVKVNACTDLMSDAASGRSRGVRETADSAGS
jgi:hypothetical protein